MPTFLLAPPSLRAPSQHPRGRILAHSLSHPSPPVGSTHYYQRGFSHPFYNEISAPNANFLIVAVDPDCSGAIAVLRVTPMGPEPDPVADRARRMAEEVPTTSVVQRETWTRRALLLIQSGVSDPEEQLRTEAREGRWDHLQRAIAENYDRLMVTKACLAAGAVVPLTSGGKVQTTEAGAAAFVEALMTASPAPPPEAPPNLFFKEAVGRWSQATQPAPLAQASMPYQDKTVQLALIDNPTVNVAVNGTTRFRPHVQGILQAVDTAEATLSASAAAAASSSAGSWAPLRRVAVVEQPILGQDSGAIGGLQSGYNFGVYTASLSARGFDVYHVLPSTWKRALGLSGRGRARTMEPLDLAAILGDSDSEDEKGGGAETAKDASRVLAARLFPSMEQVLCRKKDHGRAEALLLAAWALGIGQEPPDKKPKKRAPRAKKEPAPAAEAVV